MWATGLGKSHLHIGSGVEPYRVRTDTAVDRANSGQHLPTAHEVNMSAAQREIARYPTCGKEGQHSATLKSRGLIIRWSSVRARPALLVPGRSGFFRLGRLQAPLGHRLFIVYVHGRPL